MLCAKLFISFRAWKSTWQPKYSQTTNEHTHTHTHIRKRCNAVAAPAVRCGISNIFQQLTDSRPLDMLIMLAPDGAMVGGFHSHISFRVMGWNPLHPGSIPGVPQSLQTNPFQGALEAMRNAIENIENTIRKEMEQIYIYKQK